MLHRRFDVELGSRIIAQEIAVLLDEDAALVLVQLSQCNRFRRNEFDAAFVGIEDN
jgi:hypothetical protein